MKLRSGFVSNSSTSSFIICGWKSDPTDDTIKKLEERFGVKHEEDEDYPTDALMEFLGQCELGVGWNEDGDLMAWGRDYCSSYNESQEKLDLQEMQDILEEMKELGKALGLEDPAFYLIGQK